LYPITALLGPFANEAIAASLNTGFDDHHGVSSSCDSRLHETEADAVSLRILAHAGFDPRHAIRYWEDRIATAGKADAFLGEPADLSGTGLQRHSAGQRSGFLRSHPVDVDRLTAIRADLASWSRVAEI
jgi:predicted Zn-dependent protease